MSNLFSYLLHGCQTVYRTYRPGFVLRICRAEIQPSLIGKAVIIGGSADRGVVASCSYEARKYGVHSAMPTRQALKLCPHAIVIHGTHGRYSEASREVTEIIHRSVPLYQKTSVDEFYIDLSGMERFP
jgi:DNA polymerase-4